MAHSQLYGLLYFGSCMWLVGAGLMMLGMNKTHLASFWKPRTLRQILDQWVWDECIYATVGSGNDASRAGLLKNFTLHFWPSQYKKVRPWLVENWESWVA